MTAPQPGVTDPPAALDRESAEWVRLLGGAGIEHELAVRRLHGMLLRVARNELRRRQGRSGVSGPELDDIAHQAAADALLAVVRKVNGFRGESRFTTWAFRFVILEVSTKLGRHFWRRQPPQASEEEWDALPQRLGLDPASRVEWLDLIVEMRRAIDEDLTPYQRQLFVAIVLHEVPLDAMVARTGSSRNAIYKALFDARRKLRSALAANGHMGDERAAA